MFDEEETDEIIVFGTYQEEIWWESFVDLFGVFNDGDWLVDLLQDLIENIFPEEVEDQIACGEILGAMAEAMGADLDGTNQSLADNISVQQIGDTFVVTIDVSISSPNLSTSMLQAYAAAIQSAWTGSADLPGGGRIITIPTITALGPAGNGDVTVIGSPEGVYDINGVAVPGTYKNGKIYWDTDWVGVRKDDFGLLGHAGHEFGHVMGLDHDADGSGTMMSYDSGIDSATAVEMLELAAAYTEQDCGV